MKKNRILLLDIETSPMELYTWGMYEQTVGLNMVKKHTEILSWSAKWLGEKKVYYADKRKGGEKKMLLKLRDLLDECDIAIGHNIKSFDAKKINYRLLVNGIKRPSPYEMRDTLKIARKHFAFDSNKLEHLSNILKVKDKKLTKRQFNGFDLWRECLDGNPKAWAEMKKYNIRDTVTLEQVYNKLQAWAPEVKPEHSEHGIVCTCGSTRLHKHGIKATSSGQYQRYQCQECGAIYRDKINLRKKGAAKKDLVKL